MKQNTSAARFARRYAALGCCLIIACKVVTPVDQNGGAGGSSGGSSGAPELESGGRSSMGGAARSDGGSSARHVGGSASISVGGAVDAGLGGRSDSTAGAAGLDTTMNAGAGGEGGGADTSQDQCLEDGGCTAVCAAQTSVVCAVQPSTVACEFNVVAGTSASVTCGGTAVIGEACCGGCGCVSVEVYYDGKQCWQGIPSCEYPQFTGTFFYPHAPQ